MGTFAADIAELKSLGGVLHGLADEAGRLSVGPSAGAPPATGGTFVPLAPALAREFLFCACEYGADLFSRSISDLARAFRGFAGSLIAGTVGRDRRHHDQRRRKVPQS